MTIAKQLMIALAGLAAAGNAMAIALPETPQGNVPEPGILALIGVGIGALYLLRRK